MACNTRRLRWFAAVRRNTSHTAWPYSWLIDSGVETPADRLVPASEAAKRQAVAAEVQDRVVSAQAAQQPVQRACDVRQAGPDPCAERLGARRLQLQPGSRTDGEVRGHEVKSNRVAPSVH
jgi:hypothetical protein